MNTTFKTILIVTIILVVGGGLFFAGLAYSRWQSASYYGNGWMPTMGFRGGDNNSTFGPMNGRGNGYGPMTGGGQGPMMGNGYGWNSTDARPLTIDEAKQAAQSYVDTQGIAGLEVDEVMIFNNNAYVVIKESATGMGAFELLVDPASRVAYPEYGPNMMWNLKYGGLNHQNMMKSGNGYRGGGMMEQNNFSGEVTNVSADMPVTEEQAAQVAQTYLDGQFPGTTVSGHATTFYGYYTFDFSKNNKVTGMLSVNGYSGQVFYHTWHGTFIEETAME